MMKYCPYCGAELLNAEDKWCPVCGQKQTGFPENLAEKAKKKTWNKCKDKKSNKKSRKKKEKQAPITEVVGEPVDDGYDGYYNDVLPPDMDRTGEGIDTELMKQIILLAFGFALAIGACLVMMYTL